MDKRLVEKTVLYTIVDGIDGQQGIHCHHCDLTSWNPNDVKNRYCGACHRFLDDEIKRYRWSVCPICGGDVREAAKASCASMHGLCEICGQLRANCGCMATEV